MISRHGIDVAALWHIAKRRFWRAQTRLYTFLADNFRPGEAAFDFAFFLICMAVVIGVMMWPFGGAR